MSTRFFSVYDQKRTRMMKIRTWTQNTNLQTSSVLQFNGFSNPAQILPKCCPNTALCCLNAAQVLPKCCTTPAQIMPQSCLILPNAAYSVNAAEMLPEILPSAFEYCLPEIDKQKPPSALEKEPFQEHHLKYFQFHYIN